MQYRHKLKRGSRLCGALLRFAARCTASGTRGHSVEDVKRKTLPVDSDDWTTVVRSFIVRRKTVAPPAAAATPAATQGA